MKTFYVNYLDDKRENEILQAMKSGEAVRISASCIGHTRANMIYEQAKEFFERVGAKVTIADNYGDEYYTLKEKGN